ncbi:hypothetical protein MK805_02430 [Shimazuella sp. AN120528]|uniref:hypothetical protein n=1 Tax=Shimazuella soli TaxID=1892854 RepID=UPI001F0D0878|nr:hypothetical protein [Shimazuella soli]MCH5583824.1 hypothetical protein [Shimazuella soli]
MSFLPRRRRKPVRVKKMNHNRRGFWKFIGDVIGDYLFWLSIPSFCQVVRRTLIRLKVWVHREFGYVYDQTPPNKCMYCCLKMK